MMTLKEVIRSADDRIAQVEHQQRLEQRRARDAQRRREQRCIFAVGELVTKYFPAILTIEPGTRAENAVRFAALEAFLAELASDLELAEQLKRKSGGSRNM